MDILPTDAIFAPDSFWYTPLPADMPLHSHSAAYVVGISLVDVEAGVFSWPAGRTDGYNPNKVPNRIMEGARFRLDPMVNVAALNMHPVGKIIAHAAQRYGFVVWDKAGAISLRAQNPKSYPENPYPAIFGGTPAYAILFGFPWGRLQFLPKDYGKP